MTFLERLTKYTGDETIAQNILDAGIMIPKDKFDEKLNEIKGLNAQIKTLKDNHAVAIQAKDNELYELNTANMTEIEKANADKERLQNQLSELTIASTKAEAKARLTKAGIVDEERVNNILDSFITEDTEKSLNAIDTLVGVRVETEEATRKQIEDGVLNDQQNSGGGDENPPEVKDELDTAFLEGLESATDNF